MIWTDCYKELVEIIRNKDGFLASIPDEYSELRERMENTPEIEHIDMWHEQVSFLDEEHPFSSPAEMCIRDSFEGLRTFCLWYPSD